MLDFPSNPTEGQKYTDGNGVVWEFKDFGWKEYNPPTLDSSSFYDVAGTPTVGQQLQYDGEKWVPITKTFSFQDLSDVDQSVPANDDYMIYDGTTWKFASSSGVIAAKLVQSTNIEIDVVNDADDEGILEFEEVAYDTYNMTDLVNNKHRVYIRSDGMYTMSYHADIRFNGTNTDQHLYIRAYDSNDVLQDQWFNRLRTSTAGYFREAFTVLDNLYDGWYLEFWIYTNYPDSTVTCYQFEFSIFKETDIVLGGST